MECIKFAGVLIFLFSFRLYGSETSCKISKTHQSSPPKSCNVTVHFKIDYSCLQNNNQLHTVKVKNKKASGSNNILCFITYTGGKCDQQSGCTCGATPQRFSVTRQFLGSHLVEWEVSAELKNDAVSESVRLYMNCERSGPNNGVTSRTPEETLINKESETDKTSTPNTRVTPDLTTKAPGNGDARNKFISVGLPLTLVCLVVMVVLVVACCQKAKCRVCAPRSARRMPADAVTFRQVPDGQQDRSVVDSDESHHAYVEAIDDSAIGKTSSAGAADSESDGYLQPYISPTSGVGGHRYSGLATRRAKPDGYVNPIPSGSESTPAARTADSDSESLYEII